MKKNRGNTFFPRNRRRQFFKKNRKGISIMVGYVLLVVFIIIIGSVVYQWLITYIPTEPLGCPESVSIFIKDSSFDSSDSQLSLTLKNNGRFNIAGYFIHATNSSSQELAIIDLSPYLNEDYGGKKFGNSVLFTSTGDNSLKPSNQKTNIFDIPSEIRELYSVRVIPTRFQEENNRERFVSCGDARTEQLVGAAPVVCVPEDISVTCGARVCGDRLNNCGEIVSCPPGCTGTDICQESTGSCVQPEECTDTCTSLGYECNIQTVCGASTDCGTCSEGFSCDVSGQCVSLSGNGVCDPGEDCSDADCEGQQAQCAVGEICQSGSCVFNADGSFNSCGDYCALFGYSSTFACQDNPNKCAPPQGPEGGIYIGDVEGANETYGNSFCLGDPFCCCQP